MQNHKLPTLIQENQHWYYLNSVPCSFKYYSIRPWSRGGLRVKHSNIKLFLFIMIINQKKIILKQVYHDVTYWIYAVFYLHFLSLNFPYHFTLGETPWQDTGDSTWHGTFLYTTHLPDGVFWLQSEDWGQHFVTTLATEETTSTKLFWSQCFWVMSFEINFNTVILSITNISMKMHLMFIYIS
jgi:hypothetical protein